MELLITFFHTVKKIKKVESQQKNPQKISQNQIYKKNNMLRLWLIGKCPAEIAITDHR